MTRSQPLLRSALLLCGLVVSAPLAAEDIAPLPAEMATRAVESPLTAIAAAGNQRLVVVGSRGHILLSDDAGAHWRQVPVPVSSLLTEVTFLDAKVGWAVGHDAVVLKTTDGGETWTLKNFQPQSEPLLDVMFFDAHRGLAIGAYGVLLKSGDGGDTWAPVENELTEEGMHLNAITRLNDGRLLIVGEAGLIASSQDEGETWERAEFSYEGSLFAVRPYQAHGAIVAGLRGNSFRSADIASAAWEAIETGSEQSIFGIEAREGGYLMAGFNASMIGVSADGAASELSLRPVANGDAQDDSEAMRVDAAAFADLVVLENGEVITVGDTGVKRWAVAP